jgi:phosphatidylethanolamine-binding protein (PEBP) family uncharacterized protein
VSAGVLLALTVAALVLAGCGGGSSSDTPSSNATSSTAASSAGVDGAGTDAPAASEETGDSGTGAPAASGNATPGGGSAAGSEPQPTGAPEPGITPEQRREATVADMTLESPSSLPSSAGPPALSSQYTCDGKGTSPALRWQGVPEGTAELVLFAMNTQPVEGKLFFDWAVAGLSPEQEEFGAGKLPEGAVVGRNSFGKTGYEICPAGGGETYMFALFAVPEKLSPGKGFDPLALRKEVAGASGNVGLLALSYARG